MDMGGGLKPSEKNVWSVGIRSIPTEWKNESHVPVTTTQGWCCADDLFGDA